mgnify:CR=1 FL=1
MYLQEITYDNLANISKYKGSQRCHTRMKAASFQQAILLMQIYLFFEARLTKEAQNHIFAIKGVINKKNHRKYEHTCTQRIHESIKKGVKTLYNQNHNHLNSIHHPSLSSCA